MPPIIGREQGNDFRHPVAERLIVLPPMLQQRENIMTPAEIIEHRNVVARRLFGALCAHYPDKYVALSIQPNGVADDEPDDLIVPKWRPRYLRMNSSPLTSTGAISLLRPSLKSMLEFSHAYRGD